MKGIFIKMLFDTHTHFDDERYDEDREIMIQKSFDEGVKLMLNAGADMESSRAGILLGQKYPYIYSSVGVHPHDAANMSEENIQELLKLAKEPKVVAVGEIGLDYYYDNSPRELQKYWFRRQIQMAKEASLPIIVHDRDSHEETINILREEGASSCGGVLHCFSGSVEMAKIILDMDFYISLGGVVTFKNAKKMVEVAKYIPLDKLLIETDAPYLTPEPYRGTRNYSGLVKLVAEKIAEIRGISYEEIANITYENGKRLFRINQI